MATYVIGDVQGCFASLESLLKLISFSSQRDRLWLVGDLVNRGPQSLAVLRWVHQHRDQVKLVLGNHDLHLIARYHGLNSDKPLDTLKEVLDSPEASTLIPWLQHQPLVYREGVFAMVHGGLLPQWEWDLIARLARETEAQLQGPEAASLLLELSGKQELQWPPNEKTLSLQGAFLKILTRLRVCDANGRVHFGFSGAPSDCPEPFRPWYEWPNRLPAKLRWFFGHWSALGLLQRENLVGLDTGCVWGRQLAAFRQEDGRIFQVEAQEN